MTGEARRVLVINPGAEMYGSDRVLLAAVAALTGSGAAVSVLTSEDGPLAAEVVAVGARHEVVEFPVLRKKYFSPGGLFQLAREVVAALRPALELIRREDPEAILVNTLTSPFWSVVGRRCGVPVVVYVHEAESNHPKPVRLIMTGALRLAAAVVFNSATSAAVATGEIGPRLPPYKVVANRVTFGQPGEPVRSEAPAEPRIALVGRVSPRKGTDVAVEALAKLRADGVRASLDIVGDVFPGYEWFLDELRASVRAAGLEGAVCFHGFVEDPSQIVTQAHIVWVPSRLDESFGNVLVEAVGAARPVVASRQAGLVEAAGGSSVVRFVTPGAAEELAQTTAALLDDWALVAEAMPDEAERVRREFSGPAYERRFCEAFGELTRRGARRGAQQGLPR